jgi:hypothetical protein
MQTTMWIIIGILSFRTFISGKDKNYIHKAVLREYETIRLNIIKWIKLN